MQWTDYQKTTINMLYSILSLISWKKNPYVIGKQNFFREYEETIGYFEYIIFLSNTFCFTCMFMLYILYIDKFHLFRFHRRNWKMIIILIIFNFKYTRSFVKNKKNIENYVCFWLFKQILAQGLKIIIMSEIGQRLILT